MAGETMIVMIMENWNGGMMEDGEIRPPIAIGAIIRQWKNGRWGNSIIR
jgi:hypothetical protein